MRQSIGEFLRALRRAHRFTQQEVADRLGVSNRTVSAWERGTVMPDILLLPALAELYGVTADEILAGTQNAESSAPAEPKEPARFKPIPFWMWAAILTAVFAIGLSMLFCGWYLDTLYRHGHERALCLSLLFVGLFLALTGAAGLFLVWYRRDRGTPAYRFGLRKGIAVCAFAAAGLSLVLAAVAAAPAIEICVQGSLPSDTVSGWLWEMQYGEPLVEYFLIAGTFLLLASGFAAFGLIVWKVSKKKLLPS